MEEYTIKTIGMLFLNIMLFRLSRHKRRHTVCIYVCMCICMYVYMYVCLNSKTDKMIYGERSK